MVVNQLLKYGEFGIVLFDNFQVTERTRNQFVPKAHEGSNPSLCAKKRELHLACSSLFLAQSVGHEHCTARCEGSHIQRSREELAHQWRSDKSSRSEYPSQSHSGWIKPFFLAQREGTNTRRLLVLYCKNVPF